MTIVILGASNKPDRYSHRALVLLKAKGHHVIPVHPQLDEIEGLPVVKSLADVKEAVDTLTMYVGPERSARMIGQIVSLKPRRVIFNPGSENPELEEACRSAGIQVVHACTIVMVTTGKF